MRLTAKERILLHLLETAPPTDTLEAQRAAAQDGIAKAIWVDLRHLPQSLRPLVREGLVWERRAHVRGIRQRRKTYGLTDVGRATAILLRNRARAETVRVRDSDGFRETTVAAVLKGVDGNASIVAISRLVHDKGYVDLAALSNPVPSKFVEMVARAPRIDRFVGRTRELGAVLRDDGPRIIIVLGIAGVGKSWFAAKACEHLRERKNLFWYRIRPWDTAQSLLAGLSGFLFALDKPGLKSVLARGDVALAAQVLSEDLPRSNAFVVFDDCHEGKPEVASFFRLLKDALEGAPDIRVLMLSREVLRFYDRRDVRLSGLIEELELTGLTSDEAASLMSGGHNGGSLGATVGRHGGHPLFIALLQATHHSAFEPRLALEDFHQFMVEEIDSSLSDEARYAMKLASLCRVPIPRETLVERLNLKEDVLQDLAGAFLLHRTAEDRYEAHDSVRDFFESLLTAAERRELGQTMAGQLEDLAIRALEKGLSLESVDFASNALSLAESPEQKRRLWETLGDSRARMGDLPASVTAFREALAFAKAPETIARLHRKMAHEFLSRMDLESSAAAIEAGFQALGTFETAERGWLEFMKSRFASAIGKPEEAFAHGTAARRIFQAAGERRGEAHALAEIAGAEMARDGVADAESHLLEALQITRSVDDPLLLEFILRRLAWVVGWGRGDAEQTSTYYAEIDALAQTTGDPTIRGLSLTNRGLFALLFKADFQAAEDYLQEAGEFARRRYSAGGVLRSKESIALVRYYQGRYGEARSIMEDAIAQRRRLGHPVDAVDMMGYLAECCLLAGDLPAFREIVAQSEEPDLSAWLEIEPSTIGAYRAVVALLDGDRESALELLDEAGNRTKMPEALHYHRLASVILSVIGDAAAGDRHRQRAKELAASRSRHAFLLTFDECERRMTEVVRAALTRTDLPT